MSALLASVTPRRIKASHRRRRRVASGRLVQRYYDQSIGRFLSVDPVTANSANGSNFNRYKYAENNPYRFTDPDGRQSRELEYEYKRSGARAPPISDKDWLRKPLAYALGGVVAAPVVGFLATSASASSVGTLSADIAMGDALGGASLTAGATTLYRVVDDAELGSILNLGRFSESPNGDGVKRFLDNLPDAQALQKKFTDFFGGNQHIVEGAAPKGVMESATRTPFSDVPGRSMQSVNIPSNQVQKVTCTGSHIKQTSC